MVTCKKCKERKDSSKFGKNPTRANGLRVWCKKCESEYARELYEKRIGSVKKYKSFKDLHRTAKGIKRKMCGKCLKWKDEKDFYKCSRHKDELAIYCKFCSNKATNQARKKRTEKENSQWL